VALRDASTGEVLRSWRAHDTRLNDLIFSPDGSLLATSGDDGTLALWDPSDGELVRTLEGPEPTDRVWAITFAPDGRLVAAIWWDSGPKAPIDRIFDQGKATAKIFEVGSGRLVRSVPGLEGKGRFVPEAMVFSPDGSRLAVTDGDTAIRVIGVGTGRVEHVLDAEPGNFGTAPDVAWSPDGRLLATATDLGVAIWEPGSVAPLFEIETGTEAIAWSPDGSRLATLGDKARVWRLTDEAGRLALTLPARDVVQVGWESLAFSPDGDRLLTSSNEGDTVIWDVGVSGDAEWLNLAAQRGWRGGVAYSPSGGTIVGSLLPRAARIWDAETGETLVTFEGHGPEAEVPGVADVAVSPDGAIVATGARDSKVKLWRADTGEEVFTFSEHTGWLEDLEFSPDGALLATASQDGTARLIVVASGRELRALEHPDQVTSVAFAPDGRSLATGSFDGSARIWDPRDGSLLATIVAGSPIEAVDLGPDGALLAVGAKDGTGSVWDVATQSRLATLAGHVGEVWAVAFSPDGSLLTTGSTDATVRLWDPVTGVARLVLRGHQSSIRNVAFSPDGSRLASISDDGTIRVWALDLDDLIEIAEREVTRTFTDEECSQYLHVDTCPSDR
jgi:WD40 repeat protein